MEMRMGKYAGGKGWAELTTRDDLLLYHIHILLYDDIMIYINDMIITYVTKVACMINKSLELISTEHVFSFNQLRPCLLVTIGLFKCQKRAWQFFSRIQSSPSLDQERNVNSQKNEKLSRFASTQHCLLLFVVICCTSR